MASRYTLRKQESHSCVGGKGNFLSPGSKRTKGQSELLLLDVSGATPVKAETAALQSFRLSEEEEKKAVD